MPLPQLFMGIVLLHFNFHDMSMRQLRLVMSTLVLNHLDYHCATPAFD